MSNKNEGIETNFKVVTKKLESLIRNNCKSPKGFMFSFVQKIFPLLSTVSLRR